MQTERKETSGNNEEQSPKAEIYRQGEGEGEGRGREGDRETERETDADGDRERQRDSDQDVLKRIKRNTNRNKQI